MTFKKQSLVYFQADWIDITHSLKILNYLYLTFSLQVCYWEQNSDSFLHHNCYTYNCEFSVNLAFFAVSGLWFLVFLATINIQHNDH